MFLRDGEGRRTQCYSEEIFPHMNINFFHRTKYYSGVPLLFMFPRYNIPVRCNTVPHPARQQSSACDVSPMSIVRLVFYSFPSTPISTVTDTQSDIRSSSFPLYNAHINNHVFRHFRRKTASTLLQEYLSLSSRVPGCFSSQQLPKWQKVYPAYQPVTTRGPFPRTIVSV
jgi:hypothetical protein